MQFKFHLITLTLPDPILCSFPSTSPILYLYQVDIILISYLLSLMHIDEVKECVAIWVCPFIHIIHLKFTYGIVWVSSAFILTDK
jgi:hypothetical protein